MITFLLSIIGLFGLVIFWDKVSEITCFIGGLFVFAISQSYDFIAEKING